MKLQFEKRFEGELLKTHIALHRKGGVKKLDKVHQRIGRPKKNIHLFSTIISLKYPAMQKQILQQKLPGEKMGPNIGKKMKALVFIFCAPI
jgi:hypothetical protein